MLSESMIAILSQGKRLLRRVVVRSAVTFLVIWALAITVGIAISVSHSRSIPSMPTWLFVAGVSALPATIAGQLAGAVTMLLALTELVYSVARLPQVLVNQFTSSLKDAPAQALLAHKGGAGGAYHRFAPVAARSAGGGDAARADVRAPAPGREAGGLMARQPCWPCIAASTRSGVMGRRVSQTPTASWMAAATAGAKGTSAISATPRAP